MSLKLSLIHQNVRERIRLKRSITIQDRKPHSNFVILSLIFYKNSKISVFFIFFKNGIRLLGQILRSTFRFLFLTCWFMDVTINALTVNDGKLALKLQSLFLYQTGSGLFSNKKWLVQSRSASPKWTQEEITYSKEGLIFWKTRRKETGLQNSK